MPFTAPPLLATPADLGTYLQGDPIEDTDATALLMLRQASAKVRDFTHQFLSRVDDEQIIRTPSERGRVFLPEFPILSVSAVESSTDGGTTWAPIMSWTLDFETGELVDTSRWPHHATRAPSSWRITYSHGYDYIPDGVQAVVLDVAARTMETPIGVELERVGMRQTKFAVANLSDENEADLGAYAVAVLA